MSSHINFVNLLNIIFNRFNFNPDAVFSAPAIKNILKKYTFITKNYEFKNFLIFFLLFISLSVVHGLRDKLLIIKYFF